MFTEHATSILDILPGGMDYGLVRLRASKLVPDVKIRGLPDVEAQWVCARVVVDLGESADDQMRFYADLADGSSTAIHED